MSGMQTLDEMMADMPKSLEDAVQTKTATYEILEILGKGAFGAVFRVRRLDDEKELAMKCESHNANKKILQHEAKVYQSLRRVDSPHFISLLDRGRVPYRFIFVVMRLVFTTFSKVPSGAPIVLRLCYQEARRRRVERWLDQRRQNDIDCNGPTLLPEPY